jgi:plastocyanin
MRPVWPVTGRSSVRLLVESATRDHIPTFRHDGYRFDNLDQDQDTHSLAARRRSPVSAAHAACVAQYARMAGPALHLSRSLPISRGATRRPRALRGALVVAAAACLFFSLGFGLLTLADVASPANRGPDLSGRVLAAISRGDHLHYAFHVLAGRVLDICPCTRRAAAAQYYRATYHAITPRQRAVIAASPPRSADQWLTYLWGPSAVIGDWIKDGMAWASGDRPVAMRAVDLDDFEMLPRQVSVSRGSTIQWHNIDIGGELHALTADPGQAISFDSGALEPGEDFSFRFDQPGRFYYYCRIHGSPGLVGMSGVIVVD